LLLSFLFRSLLAAALLIVAARQASAGRVPCVEIVRKATSYTSRTRGKIVDVSELAKQMGTSVAWVEHCLRAFGRRPKRPSLESHEGREAELEMLEDEEPEESFAEDQEEPGARERPPSTQRPRYLSIKPSPAPYDRRDQLLQEER
jgi:hypothetical protein